MTAAPVSTIDFFGRLFLENPLPLQEGAARRRPFGKA